MAELRANSVQRSMVQLLGRAPSNTLTGLWGALAASSVPSRHYQFGPFLKTSKSRTSSTLDTSKTITVVDGSLSLPIESSLENPVQPLLEHYDNSELQVEVSNPSTTIITQVGIFSLPAELLCHILLLLHFKDLSHCALVRHFM